MGFIKEGLQSTNSSCDNVNVPLLLDWSLQVGVMIYFIYGINLVRREISSKAHKQSHNNQLFNDIRLEKKKKYFIRNSELCLYLLTCY